MELQTFPHAVLYHQAAAPGAGVASGQIIAESIRPSVSGLVVLNDPEVHTFTWSATDTLLQFSVQTGQPAAAEWLCNRHRACVLRIRRSGG